MGIRSASQTFTADGSVSGFDFGSQIDSIHNIVATVDGISQDPNVHYFLGASGGDSSFSSVLLLLHMNGSDGSTTFTDSSSSNRTVTAHNGAAISTDQNKFGGASAEFDGSNDYLSLASSSDWVMAGNFTIEAWFYLDATSNKTIAGQWPSNGGVASWQLWTYQSKLTFSYRPSNNVTVNLQSSSTPSTGQWHHVAIVRNGSTQTLYFNGSSVATDTNSDTIGRSDIGVNIGRIASGADYMDGYIDELRITKGVARYTGNFTPRTSEFPDSAPVSNSTVNFIKPPFNNSNIELRYIKTV